LANPADSVVGGYEHIQERGGMKLLSDIMKAPTKAYISIKWYTAETLLTLVYAKNFGEDGGDLRTLLHILETFVTDMHPLAYMVDTFPVLDMLPDMLAPWRAKAKKMHTYEATVRIERLIYFLTRADSVVIVLY
jgi:hypothetical protein